MFTSIQKQHVTNGGSYKQDNKKRVLGDGCMANSCIDLLHDVSNLLYKLALEVAMSVVNS